MLFYNVIENKVDILSFLKDPSWFRLLVMASEQVKFSERESNRQRQMISSWNTMASTAFLKYFFSFFFFAVSLSGSLEGCWSLSQGHKGEGRVHPWMIRQLIQGPMWAVGGLVPCSTVSQQCSAGTVWEPPPTSSVHPWDCTDNPWVLSPVPYRLSSVLIIVK